MKIIYNKLIRDRIPEIIREEGKECEVEVMGEDEYRQALLEKLVEEAEEAAKAGDGELVVEIADLLEVIDAVLDVWGIPEVEVMEIKRERCQMRGGFERRFRLISTE